MPKALEFISSDGKLMLVEVVIPPGREAHFGKFIDLNMLVMTGGLERTEDQFRKLLEASGWGVLTATLLSALLKPPQLDPGSAVSFASQGRATVKRCLFLRGFSPLSYNDRSQH